MAHIIDAIFLATDGAEIFTGRIMAINCMGNTRHPTRHFNKHSGYQTHTRATYYNNKQPTLPPRRLQANHPKAEEILQNSKKSTAPYLQREAAEGERRRGAQRGDSSILTINLKGSSSLWGSGFSIKQLGV